LSSQLVSVVIPAYNAEITLEDTLRSVRGQTHGRLEIIVVDDGSTDNTASIVRTHAAADHRVILKSQENSGVAAARNAGWHLAQSDLIAFIDADDLWAPTKIEKQLEAMLQGGEEVGLVYTWFDVIDESNHVRFRVQGRNIAGDVLPYTFRGNFVGHASSPLIRREALVHAGGFDSRLRDAGVHGCEDWLLYHRIATRFQFGLVPEYLTGYRVVSGRMSSNRPRMFKSYLMVADEMKARHPERSAAVDAGIRFYLRFLIGEALAFRDFGQVYPLLSLWAFEHPWDLLAVPTTVVASKIGFHLNWIGLMLIGRLRPKRTVLFLSQKNQP
jgi:glycosyltransferase involved in cell wall biosynthesis